MKLQRRISFRRRLHRMTRMKAYYALSTNLGPVVVQAVVVAMILKLQVAGLRRLLELKHLSLWNSRYLNIN